jgi:hypothetical protein
VKVRVDPLNRFAEFDLTFYNSDEYNHYKKKLLKYLKAEGFLDSSEEKTFIIKFRDRLYEVKLNN